MGRLVNISQVQISHFEKWEKLTYLIIFIYFEVNISHIIFLIKGKSWPKLMGVGG